MLLERARPGRRLTAEAAIRFRDACLAGILVIASSPVLLLVGIAVAISSPGPILFRQERIGRCQRPFHMLKFRTMAVDSNDEVHREFVTKMLRDELAHQGGDELFNLTEDERITGVGRILRRFSLDELPQLFNVLSGQMSLVGPRPALPWEVELFQPRHRARFEVKPGMTGLWQVKGRSSLSMNQALDLDVEYVERRTFWLDLGILARTVPVVLSGRGAS